MPGDISDWLNIIDRLDVFGLAAICLIGFWKIIRNQDENVSQIRNLLTVHSKEIEHLNEWRARHMVTDREDHNAIHTRIDNIKRLVG